MPEVQSFLAQAIHTIDNSVDCPLAKLLDEAIAQPLDKTRRYTLDWKSTTRNALECHALAALMKLLHWFMKERSLALYHSGWPILWITLMDMTTGILETLLIHLVDAPDFILLREQCWQQLTEHAGMGLVRK